MISTFLFTQLSFLAFQVPLLLYENQITKILWGVNFIFWLNLLGICFLDWRSNQKSISFNNLIAAHWLGNTLVANCLILWFLISTICSLGLLFSHTSISPGFLVNNFVLAACLGNIIVLRVELEGFTRNYLLGSWLIYFGLVVAGIILWFDLDRHDVWLKLSCLTWSHLVYHYKDNLERNYAYYSLTVVMHIAVLTSLCLQLSDYRLKSYLPLLVCSSLWLIYLCVTNFFELSQSQYIERLLNLNKDAKSDQSTAKPPSQQAIKEAPLSFREVIGLVRQLQNRSEVPKGIVCSVCQEQVWNSPDFWMKQLSCGHFFHVRCVWLTLTERKTTPCCQMSFSEIRQVLTPTDQV